MGRSSNYILLMDKSQVSLKKWGRSSAQILTGSIQPPGHATHSASPSQWGRGPRNDRFQGDCTLVKGLNWPLWPDQKGTEFDSVVSFQIRNRKQTGSVFHVLFSELDPKPKISPGYPCNPSPWLISFGFSVSVSETWTAKKATIYEHSDLSFGIKKK